jgi:tetratricopeptide (TPR) repeat protein
MGEVWRACDERLDRHVAVKLLPAGLAADPERRARMLREAKAAAAVPHPNVVTLYDIVSEGERDVLVMELVEGQTLSETIRRGVPEVKEALEWLIGIADALATAHARGILHRDIKAANMMVTLRRGIKVLDFGLAKLRDDGGGVVTGSTAQREAIALDATMASGSGRGRGTGTGTGYQTVDGSLIGTPMYMAPEQIEGQRADERSEVFSVGVVAFEVLTGKPPYTAKTLDELFEQIVKTPLPAWPDRVPAPVREVVARALAKDPAQRIATMAQLRDELRAVRDELFAPPRRRWPLAVALGAGALAAAVATWLMVRDRADDDRPGDAQVRRALEEYDVFYGDKALSSLRAALRIAPDHPRAHAYLILFGDARPDEQDAAAAAAERIAATVRGRDRALLDAAIALRRRGPAAARRALADAGGAGADRELAFWAAELAYRAGDFATARDGFAALVDAPQGQATFLGRIYDHYSSVLIWADAPDEAVRIGALYHDKFPGEADGAGVYATTLALAGRLDDALRYARDALALAEGEDTLAGLGKVHALRGELAFARDHYRRSLERAPDRRRPLRRAALALLQWMVDDDEGAAATVAPCLPGGAEAAIPQRGACLFVAGVVDPKATEAAIRELDALAAAASELAPAYGDPASLADLLRAHQRFPGAGCLKVTAPPAPPDEALAELDAAWTAPSDFYAVYHVPFFASWATCERALLAWARGDPRGAAEILAPVAERAPGRSWLIDDLVIYRGGGP